MMDLFLTCILWLGGGAFVATFIQSTVVATGWYRGERYAWRAFLRFKWERAIFRDTSRISVLLISGLFVFVSYKVSEVFLLPIILWWVGYLVFLRYPFVSGLLLRTLERITQYKNEISHSSTGIMISKTEENMSTNKQPDFPLIQSKNKDRYDDL
jgi:hypothetical protein